MAEIHTGATLSPTKLELLTLWMPRQRWYTGKTSGIAVPALTKVGGYRLDDPAGQVGIEVMILTDSSGSEPVTYQVPLTYRAAPVVGLEHALVGTMQHSVLGRRYVYDGAHDPVFAAQFIQLLVGNVAAQAQSVSNTPQPDVAATTLGPAHHLRLASHRVLTGNSPTPP